MFNLPENADLSFLQNKELELICFAAYQVNLHFAEGVSITIFGSFQHLVAGRNISANYKDFPIQSSELMRLVMNQIQEIKPKHIKLEIFKRRSTPSQRR
jgi:hypothetical protein